MATQPFEYFAACAVGATALFVFFQVSIFGEAGKGWIDRPWYIRAPMAMFGASLVYKLFAFLRLHEHFTQGGAVVASCLVFWQFNSLLYAICESYKERGMGLIKVLFDRHPAWGAGEIPPYVNPKPLRVKTHID